MSINGMFWNSILKDTDRIADGIKDRMADKKARLAAERMLAGSTPQGGGGSVPSNPLGLLGMSGLDLMNTVTGGYNPTQTAPGLNSPMNDIMNYVVGGYKPPQTYDNMFGQMANNVTNGLDIYGNPLYGYNRF